MTDTTANPLSTAVSAALQSEATGPAHLTEDIVVALMRAGAIAGPAPHTNMNMPALHAVMDVIGAPLLEIIAAGGQLDEHQRTWSAKLAVAALRDASLLIDSAT